MDKYDKLKISMKYWLLGRNYYIALKAFEFGRSFHDGTRKDGLTPEFQHQLEIAHFLRTFDDAPEFENVLAATFLHDIREDFHISQEELIHKFSQEVYDIVWLMTKKYRKMKITNSEYYRLLSENRHAALLKGADRINNLKSMVGVFSADKQKEYVAETKEYVLPMIKEARMKYPEYETKFEHIKFILMEFLKFIEKAQ